MAFVLQDVIIEREGSRILETLKKLKKENLVKVNVDFRIKQNAKSHIFYLIEDYCVKNNISDEVEVKPTTETAEVLRLKLEFELEEL